MKAAIYSPYLDALGGGERYVLSVARVLLEEGWNVDIEAKDEDLTQKVKERFGFDLGKAKITQSVKRGDGYDLMFWLSDGSVPILFARRNIFHFQRPFYNVDGKSLINRMKFIRIKKVVVNSYFTKKWVDREYPKESIVIYPPIDIERFRSRRKEKLILYVGRFSELGQAKRQDILVKNFMKMVDLGIKDWELILAGASDVGRTKNTDKLIEESRNYPISILENPNFKEIVNLYSKARIFWSAAGFGVNEQRSPERTEHFGITVVEAMASEAVPIIFEAGGHKEIVNNGKNGFLWRFEEDLRNKTSELINDKYKLKNMANIAKRDSVKYSYERFKKEIIDLIS